MCGVPKIVPIDAEYLITSAKLSALISRSAGEYKRDEDTFAVFSADDIETQARTALLQRYGSHFSVSKDEEKLRLQIAKGNKKKKKDERSPSFRY